MIVVFNQQIDLQKDGVIGQHIYHQKTLIWRRFLKLLITGDNFKGSEKYIGLFQ